MLHKWSSFSLTRRSIFHSLVPEVDRMTGVLIMVVICLCSMDFFAEDRNMSGYCGNSPTFSLQGEYAGQLAYRRQVGGQFRAVSRK